MPLDTHDLGLSPFFHSQQVLGDSFRSLGILIEPFLSALPPPKKSTTNNGHVERIHFRRRQRQVAEIMFANSANKGRFTNCGEGEVKQLKYYDNANHLKAEKSYYHTDIAFWILILQMYHFWCICFYMIRLGSTKKGRLRPSSILQQKGNYLGKKNIPFLHRQSWCRYQINPMFELPVTKGSGKSTGFFKDPVFVRFFWLGTLTTLKIYSSQTDKL